MTKTDSAGMFSEYIPFGDYKVEIIDPEDYELTTGNNVQIVSITSNTKRIEDVGYYAEYNVSTNISITPKKFEKGGLKSAVIEVRTNNLKNTTANDTEVSIYLPNNINISNIVNDIGTTDISQDMNGNSVVKWNIGDLDGNTTKFLQINVFINTELAENTSYYDIYSNILCSNIETNVDDNQDIDTYEIDVSRYSITTEAKEGGYITGEGKNPFEVVEKGKDSVNDIFVIPDAGFIISEVTVNGKKIAIQNYVEKLLLDKFKNVQTNIHVIATFEKNITSIEVTKLWEDNDNEVLKRPETVVLQIKNGEEVVREQVVSESTDWKYTFSNLPKYDEFGNEIKYTVDERDIGSKFYEKILTNETTVTNKFVVPDEKIEIEAIKIWEDNDNEALKRPETVVLQIKNGEKVVREKEISEADNWKYTFSNLPKYDEFGNIINYEIYEKPINYYETKIDGNTIINICMYENSVDTGDINLSKYYIIIILSLYIIFRKIKSFVK